MSVLREFLEFIEGSKPEPVEKLLHRVLLKSRELTGAEAGTIFIVRGRAGSRRLEAADSQNDVIAVKPASFVVPITTSSIAGYTAATGETVFVDDLYDLPGSVPYTFDRSFDEHHEYRSHSMLAFPLLNYDRRVVGVVQLINRRSPGSPGTGTVRGRAGGFDRSRQPHPGRRHRAGRHASAHQGPEHQTARPESDPGRAAGADRRAPGRD